MAAYTRYTSDDPSTRVIHPSQQETTSRQWTEIRPMPLGTRHTDLSLRAKTNPYLKQVQQMGKILISASIQRTDLNLMAVSQRTEMSWIVA